MFLLNLFSIEKLIYIQFTRWSFLKCILKCNHKKANPGEGLLQAYKHDSVASPPGGLMKPCL